MEGTVRFSLAHRSEEYPEEGKGRETEQQVAERLWRAPSSMFGDYGAKEDDSVGEGGDDSQELRCDSARNEVEEHT